MYTDFVDFFDALASTTKIADKKAILAEATPDQQQLLVAALDRSRNYYVTRKTLDLQDPKEGVLQTSTVPFLCMLDKLHTRQMSGNVARRFIRQLFCAYSPDKSRILAKILFREPLGVDAKLVNAVYKGLVPEFAVLLAPNTTPDLKTDVRYPVIIQPKLDGLRCIAFVNDDGTVEMVTRNGKTIRNPLVVANIAKTISRFPGYVFDGEIYKHGWKFSDIFSIASTEEPLNHTVNESFELEFHIWDALTASEWASRQSNLPYLARYKLLRNSLSSQEDTNPAESWEPISEGCVRIVAAKIVHNARQATEVYQELLIAGYEGGMLKDPDGPYMWKRATIKQGTIAKLKVFETADLEITGYVEGEGKHAGRLGKFLVSFKNNEVGVGSGYTDEDRERFWARRDQMIGQIIEVKYFEETLTDCKASLRFPVYVRERKDKTD